MKKLLITIVLSLLLVLSGYAADIDCDGDSNNNHDVACGGTNVSTLTDGGVLLGSDTEAVTPMAVLADGELIVGDGTTDPVAESGATLRTSLGLGTGDDVTFNSVTTAATAEPGSVYNDSDGAGADKEASKDLANMTITTDGAEVSDRKATYMDAGTRRTFWLWDGSAYTFSLGNLTDDWAGGDVAGQESIKWDFNTTEGEIGVSSPSGATKINYGSLNLGTSGTVETGALNADGVVNFGGATSTEIVNGTNPTTDAAGEIAVDSDDNFLEIFGSASRSIPTEFSIPFTIYKPNDLDDAQRDFLPFFTNNTGASITITKIYAMADITSADFRIEEYDADGSSNEALVKAETCDQGVGPYTNDGQSTITNATIENGHILVLDCDDIDIPDYLHFTIWYTVGGVD